MKTIIYTSHVSRIAVVIQLLKCLTKCFVDDILDKRSSPFPQAISFRSLTMKWSALNNGWKWEKHKISA